MLRFTTLSALVIVCLVGISYQKSQSNLTSLPWCDQIQTTRPVGGESPKPIEPPRKRPQGFNRRGLFWSLIARLFAKAFKGQNGRASGGEFNAMEEILKNSIPNDTATQTNVTFNWTQEASGGWTIQMAVSKFYDTASPESVTNKVSSDQINSILKDETIMSKVAAEGAKLGIDMSPAALTISTTTVQTAVDSSGAITQTSCANNICEQVSFDASGNVTLVATVPPPTDGPSGGTSQGASKSPSASGSTAAVNGTGSTAAVNGTRSTAAVNGTGSTAAVNGTRSTAVVNGTGSTAAANGTGSGATTASSGSNSSSSSSTNFEIIIIDAVKLTLKVSARALLIGSTDATSVETAIKNTIGSNAVVTSKLLSGSNYTTVITLNTNTSSSSSFTLESQLQSVLSKLKSNEAILKASVPAGLSLAVDTTNVEITANELLTVNGVQKKVSCTKKTSEKDITCVKGNVSANGTIAVESTSKISVASFSLRTTANVFTVMLFTFTILYYKFDF